MVPKFKKVADILKTRIESGDYELRSFPSARTLAVEMGISYVTARRATKKLIETGLIRRNKTNRIELVKKNTSKKHLRLAILRPTFLDGTNLAQGIHNAVGVQNWVWEIGYTHPDDPVILQSLCDNYDGVFFFPPHNLSPIVLEQMISAREKLITLAADYTNYGILCLDDTPSAAIHEMIRHLHSIGHRRIHCINTAYAQHHVQNRIDQWQTSLRQCGIDGRLFNAPVSYGQAKGQPSYALMTDLLTSKQWDSSAVFCTRVITAQGVMKAIADQGFQIGKDISICSFRDTENAWLSIPSLTTTKATDFTPYVKKAMEWIKTGGKGWKGSLMLRSDVLDITIGESTTAYKARTAKF